MKISITASIIILLAAAFIGWQNHQRLVSIRESHARLVAAASELGLSFNRSNPEDPIRITKREREDKSADAKLAAAELIAYHRDMEKFGNNGIPRDEASQEKMLAMMDRMWSLDSSQLKIVITQINAAKDLKEQTRKNLINHAIMTLANDHPQAALALLTESSNSSMVEDMNSHIISSSLVKWAKNDPIKAAEWVRINSEKFPELITDDAKNGLIAGTALHNPKLAFKLIGELGLKETFQAISQIIAVATTAEQRTTTLAALREHLATLDDETAKKQLSDPSLRNIANSMTRESFETASQWVATANLTPEELDSFAGGLNSYSMDEKNGQWIEWIGKNLIPDKANNHISNMVGSWTRNDYQAAGTWLTTLPAGPTKNAAITAYAQTISNYEPETAAQWALTLPAGKDRENTLKQIYQNWPKNDPTAKEAFKQKHGIK